MLAKALESDTPTESSLQKQREQSRRFWRIGLITMAIALPTLLLLGFAALILSIQ